MLAIPWHGRPAHLPSFPCLDSPRPRPVHRQLTSNTRTLVPPGPIGNVADAPHFGHRPTYADPSATRFARAYCPEHLNHRRRNLPCASPVCGGRFASPPFEPPSSTMSRASGIPPISTPGQPTPQPGSKTTVCHRTPLADILCSNRIDQDRAKSPRFSAIFPRPGSVFLLQIIASQ